MTKAQDAKLVKRLRAAQALEAKRRRQLAEAEAMVAALIGSQPTAPAKATVVLKPATARARKPAKASRATTRKVAKAAKPATTRKPASTTTRKRTTTRTEPDAGSAT